MKETEKNKATLELIRISKRMTAHQIQRVTDIANGMLIAQESVPKKKQSRSLIWRKCNYHIEYKRKETWKWKM